MVTSPPLTIKETQEHLKKKDFTAVELVDSYLARINAQNPELNTFLTITQEEAYVKAKWVDKIITELGEEAFTRHPLLGVTVAYKDLYLTKGVRTTAASKVLESYVPAYSATVVKKLDSAGVIMLGKTNCDAWAHGSSGENSDFGPTKNPWGKEYTPGGSSSGSAASIAANLSLIATGTDTGGSIRLPASFCGVVGLKPTYGRVSRYGIIAMASSVDSIGHFTRTVEDAETFLKVTEGEDGNDATVKKSEYESKSSKLRIGIPKEYWGEGLDKEVKDLVTSAIKVFEKNGIEVKEVSLPHTKYAVAVYYIVIPAEISSNLSRYDGIRFGNDRNTFGDEAKRRIMLGTYVLSSGYYDAYYLRAMKVRTKIREDFDNVFNSVDALIAPVSPTPPFKLGEKVTDPLTMYLSDIYTVSANLAGIPGLAIPCGFSKSGLPVGFQLMGPRFSEELLFRLGKVYQSNSTWHTNLPNKT